MNIKELTTEISIEFELLDNILIELSNLKKDIEGREPTTREKTAAAAFMAQFYGGIENVLKRISVFNSIPIPVGDAWHITLFKNYCETSHGNLPVLFDNSLSISIAPFRKFRHVVYHSYGFQLDWDRMKEGLQNIDDVFLRFKDKVQYYLNTMKGI